MKLVVTPRQLFSRGDLSLLFITIKMTFHIQNIGDEAPDKQHYFDIVDTFRPCIFRGITQAGQTTEQRSWHLPLWLLDCIASFF